MAERILSSQAKQDDQVLDQTLRPKTFKDYVGQKKVKQNLEIAMQAAHRRQESLDHILLYGPPGLGKTTLAHLIAQTMGVNLRVTSGPAIERAGDLAAILTNLQNGDVLFIDEIHRLNRVIEEVLYPAMEDYLLDIVIGKGPSARTLRLDLPKFTLIGATTMPNLLSSPLRDRFGLVHRLNFYEDQEVEEIITRNAKILITDIVPPAVQEIARRARKTPRVANRLLKRVRDFAQVKANGKITLPLAQEALALLEIDLLGLDELDRRILEIIIEKFQGGPVGLNTIAASVAEEMATIEEIYEPFLLQLGLLKRTPRGRMATEAAYKHLKKESKAPSQNQSLFKH